MQPQSSFCMFFHLLEFYIHKDTQFNKHSCSKISNSQVRKFPFLLNKLEILKKNSHQQINQFLLINPVKIKDR